MQAGISTATLFLRLNNEDALPLFAEWKVPVCEVFLTSFSEYAPSFARLLGERKGEVAVHSVHVLNTQFEPQLYSEHPRVRSDAFRWLEEAMESARILGAGHYTFHGPARLKRTFTEQPRFVTGTARVSDVCGKYGVRLCYENVEWAYFNRPALFAPLAEACPALGAVLDLKQARLSGYDWREYLAAMGQRLTHVHVSDLDSAGNLCLPGRGTFDFGELIARLRDVGFDGPLLIENYAGDFGELRELKQSFEFLAEAVSR